MDGRLPDFDRGAGRLDDRAASSTLSPHGTDIALDSDRASRRRRAPWLQHLVGREAGHAGREGLHVREEGTSTRAGSSTKMQELDAKTEELKGKAANASESVKREFDKDMSELSRQKGRAQSEARERQVLLGRRLEDTKAGASRPGTRSSAPTSAPRPASSSSPPHRFRPRLAAAAQLELRPSPPMGERIKSETP